jgi:glycosyltransferase involved in cell wall biosynthesis
MPVYNGEEYIHEALDSLLAQTFTDFELVISDNASIDNTEAICREYAARDPRIRYVRQTQNRGAMPNFQFVLAEARGECFMWAAADDRWDNSWIATLMPHLRSEAVSVAFGCVASLVDQTQSTTRTTLSSLRGPVTFRVLRYFFWREAGAKPNVIYGLYRTSQLRNAAAEVLTAGADNRLGVDNLLVFRMLHVGCSHVDPGVTFYKRSRQHTGDSRITRLIAATAVQLLRLRYVPYFIEHIRTSPSMFVRCAVVLAIPIKYPCSILDCFGVVAHRALKRASAMISFRGRVARPGAR